MAELSREGRGGSVITVSLPTVLLLPAGCSVVEVKCEIVKKPPALVLLVCAQIDGYILVST